MKMSSRTVAASPRRGGIPTGALLFLLSSGEGVAAEEAVQLLHFAGGIVRLAERFEPWQLGLDETRERFDRRRDGQLFAGLLARDEFIERGAHNGFVEHPQRTQLECMDGSQTAALLAARRLNHLAR